jgi:hypothetical protein
MQLPSNATLLGHTDALNGLRVSGSGGSDLDGTTSIHDGGNDGMNDDAIDGRDSSALVDDFTII